MLEKIQDDGQHWK